MKRIGLGAASLSLMLLISTAFGQGTTALPDNVVELRKAANQAWDEGNKEMFRSAVRRLHQLRPNNGDYMYQLVLGHAMLNEFTEAFNVMLSMQRQGFSYDFNQTLSSMSLRDKPIYPYLNDLMIKAGEPFGEASVIARLDAEVGQVEAIDWDSSRQAFLVGTVTDGRLLAVSEDGSFTELLRADAENGLWGIHDVVVDEARKRLWLTSSAIPAFAGYDPIDKNRSAVFEFELDSLELVKRYPVPVDGLPHVLGQAALAPSGDLFFADRYVPIVYQLKAGDDRLRPLVAARNLVSLRGIAVADDGSKLYVADYEMGIVVIDLKEGTAGDLARSETLNLGGIQGLEYLDGSLAIVQSGFRPQRIMRLQLDDSGVAVENVAPVAVALDLLDEPGFSTLVGEDLVFFANGAGRGNRDSVEPVRIARAGLTDVAYLVPPDMKKFLEEQERRLLEQAAERRDAEAGAADLDTDSEPGAEAEPADSQEEGQEEPEGENQG
jgi:hypothetical protein